MTKKKGAINAIYFEFSKNIPEEELSEIFERVENIVKKSKYFRNSDFVDSDWIYGKNY